MVLFIWSTLCYIVQSCVNSLIIAEPHWSSNSSSLTCRTPNSGCSWTVLHRAVPERTRICCKPRIISTVLYYYYYLESNTVFHVENPGGDIMYWHWNCWLSKRLEGNQICPFLKGIFCTLSTLFFRFRRRSKRIRLHHKFHNSSSLCWCFTFRKSSADR